MNKNILIAFIVFAIFAAALFEFNSWMAKQYDKPKIDENNVKILPVGNNTDKTPKKIITEKELYYGDNTQSNNNDVEVAAGEVMGSKKIIYELPLDNPVLVE